MKTLFIEARSVNNVRLPGSLIKSLPSKIGLTTTVQYIGSIEGIKKQLESAGKKARLIKAAKSVYQGQTLGCIAVEKLNETFKDCEAVLYVGDGNFHPIGIAIAFEGKKDVFAYNPDSGKSSRVDKDAVEKVQRQKKGNLSKFYASDSIGVLISTKPGQMVVQKRKKQDLQKKYPDKRFYAFIADNIVLSELENFPFIECWVNTACPMIAYETYFESSSGQKRKSMINIDDIE